MNILYKVNCPLPEGIETILKRLKKKKVKINFLQISSNFNFKIPKQQYTTYFPYLMEGTGNNMLRISYIIKKEKTKMLL